MLLNFLYSSWYGNNLDIALCEDAVSKILQVFRQIALSEVPAAIKCKRVDLCDSVWKIDTSQIYTIIQGRATNGCNFIVFFLKTYLAEQTTFCILLNLFLYIAAHFEMVFLENINDAFGFYVSCINLLDFSRNSVIVVIIAGTC